VRSDKEQVIDEKITVAGVDYHMTCVSMGNPHAVMFVGDTEHFPLEKAGPLFEHHEVFPNRVNAEFVQVIDRHTVKMRVWERGSGETLACGTGACAVTVASILNDKVDGSKPVTVQLLGGDLNISWERDENLVYMTGPATTVFDGEIDLGFLGE
jgi:diaminopimelate epimerase